MGMKEIILLLACVLVVIGQSNLPTFAQYVVSYGKTYSTAESQTRQANYNNRVSTFTALNALYNMTSGVNNFTDWTTDELASTIILIFQNSEDIKHYQVQVEQLHMLKKIIHQVLLIGEVKIQLQVSRIK